MSQTLEISAIISILKNVLNKKDEPIPLHEPSFIGKEWEYVKDCLDTGWVSSAGKYVDAFEDKLVQYTGAKHAVAVVNGTAALHICLKLAGVSTGDEVLLPALTFVATANAVSYCGASPHFMDSDIHTLGVPPDKLEHYLKEITIIRDGTCYNKQSMRPIRAVIVMHTFGQPADLDPLMELCGKYKLELIEDAAEAMGSLYKKRHVGNFGKLSSLSFNGNKIITTGGGGAILTNDSKLAIAAKHISTTAKLQHQWSFVHDQIGYNYRLPNINAALGCAQIENMDRFLRDKRSLAKKYRDAFTKIQGASFFQECAFARSNYWLNVLLLDETYAAMRDLIISAANVQGICTRPPWTLLNKLAMFQTCPHMDLSMAESLERRIINLPSSAKLGEEHGWET